MHDLCYIFQSFLANEDIGDSLEGVETLITKHENFEKTLAAQEEKFKASHNITLTKKKRLATVESFIFYCVYRHWMRLRPR